MNSIFWGTGARRWCTANMQIKEAYLNSRRDLSVRKELVLTANVPPSNAALAEKVKKCVSTLHIVMSELTHLVRAHNRTHTFVAFNRARFCVCTHNVPKLFHVYTQCPEHAKISLSANAHCWLHTQSDHLVTMFITAHCNCFPAIATCCFTHLSFFTIF